MGLVEIPASLAAGHAGAGARRCEVFFSGGGASFRSGGTVPAEADVRSTGVAPSGRPRAGRDPLAGPSPRRGGFGRAGGGELLYVETGGRSFLRPYEAPRPGILARILLWLRRILGR